MKKFCLFLITGLTLIFQIDKTLAQGAPTTITLTPARDNTISPSDNPERSGGASPYFFSGRSQSGRIFRALLAFDLSSLPTDATITEVSLTIHVERARSPSLPYQLFRLTQDWGEGSSSGGQGNLAEPATDDATWSNRFFGMDSPWNSPGGDFVADASATTNIAGEEASYTFTGDTLVADLQAWLADSTTNFGWILIGPEDGTTAKRFVSSEGVEANRPQLSITYTSAVTSLPAFPENSLSLFPNPSSEAARLEYQRLNTRDLQIELLDAKGEVISIQDYQLPRESGQISLPVQALPQGLYYVRVQGGGRSATFRLVR